MRERPGDGDFMMGPGAMWTAAHHKIPLLMVIHNNRAWHQETMSVQIMASRRSRHPERGRIGTVITDPNINYAKARRKASACIPNRRSRRGRISRRDRAGDQDGQKR